MAFWYFGYGSNMDLRSLSAKGVEPRSSERAVLRGWRLRFNVQHFFLHEGGVGNIECTDDRSDVVWGVVHYCNDEHLPLLDAAEAFGHGYDRIEINVLTEHREVRAITYVGIPSFLNNACLPTQRYLNILLKGATAAGLDVAYINAIRAQPVRNRGPVLPFVPPSGNYGCYTAAALSRHPPLTALAGAVFDMSGARWQHSILHDLFGGKDMTLFHLKRMDTSNGSETLEDVKQNRLSRVQREYLDEYLHAYSTEYAYVGRYLYE